jgi:signal transduction histidine kinase
MHRTAKTVLIPPRRTWRRSFAKILPLAVFPLVAPVWRSAADDSVFETVTNLHQLQSMAGSADRFVCGLQLAATVCAASRPEVGAVVVQDETGVELLQMGGCAAQLRPGDKIRLEGSRCLLRRRETGVIISAAPVVDNDGLHAVKESTGKVLLAEGFHPLQLDWFNGALPSDLELFCEGPQKQLQKVPGSALWRRDDSGVTDYLPGLHVECYEGYWQFIPDFNWLTPTRSGSVANIGLEFCTQPEFVGLRFTGFFKALRDGEYTFRVSSDDGALLYIDGSCPLVRTTGREAPPPATAAVAGREMTGLNEGRWVAVEGRVSFVTQTGKGMELELRSSSGTLQVKVADAPRLDEIKLLNARIRARGVGRGVLTLEKKPVLGRLLVASAKELEILEPAPGTDSPPALLTTAEQVQGLRREEAERHLPVRIRGVVTSALYKTYRGISIQDDTRGIFVGLHGITNTISPACGELWEVIGHTAPGDFAPTIVAEDMRLLGAGRLPEPAHPTWNQLINGSLDVQWVEIQAVVTSVSSNRMGLLFPEGSLDAEFYLWNETHLRPFLDNHVRIRAALWADWDGNTHEVRPGQITLRNAFISIDRPAPLNVFDAPLKTGHDLLRFDVLGVMFQRVKVRGQVVHADARQLFLMDEESGLRVLPINNVEVQPGDLVEAVGYPEISGLSPVLQEAMVRKTGFAPLRQAPLLADSDVIQGSNNCSRVRMTGKLLGWHTETEVEVLEMQSAAHLFLARLAAPAGAKVSLRVGSRLELCGVYVAEISSRQPGGASDGFELLLNSPADIRVLSQPSWWTLSRLLGLLGLLFFILMLASLWITQLRRQVEQRTVSLQREIRERERAERQRALEAERSRIARDLHDDLGSSLTEICVLASTGIRPLPTEEKSPRLFRSINDKARALIAALDVIVWAVDPEENSLQSLADYLSGYAAEYLENTGIACRFKIPVALPRVTLEGRVRHDLFLAIKEVLHNVVQHSRATEVEFHLAITEAVLEIRIADNGCGFERREGDGHGLKNLPARLVQMGGRCEVTSSEARGTQVRILLNFPGTSTAAEAG